MIRLDQVNIVVRDMSAMAEFYRRLGLDIRSSPPEWAPHHRNSGPDGGDIELDSPQFAAVWNKAGPWAWGSFWVSVCPTGKASIGSSTS